MVGLPLLVAIESGPGIIALARLVFAGTPDQAAEVLETWDTNDRIVIAFANGLDYLFGLLLFGTLAVGCAAVAGRDGSARPTRRSSIFVWLATLAIVLDVPENSAYLRMVLGSTDTPWPQLAAATSAPRFAIFFLCAATILSSAWMDRRRVA